MKYTPKATAFVLVLLVAGVSAFAAPAEHSFVGTKTCKKCHIKQWKSWQTTTMAQAYESLRPGKKVEEKVEAGLLPDFDYTAVGECVACHVTGYGEEGGFISLEETPNLVGVGCEGCHGPGGTYTQDQYMSLRNKEFKRSDIVAVGLVDVIGVEQCVPCHNERSPFVDEGEAFDYERLEAEDTHEHFALKYEH